MAVRVGTFVFPEDLAVGHDAARRRLAMVAEAGLDHVGVADHVSFRDGQGFDGLATAAVVAGLHPFLVVQTSVYLLPLRPPVPVARQLSTLTQLAPGRLVFGVGIGGEDRHEIEMCGVDPRTRGRRADEYLAVLRQLLTGKPVDFDGEFVTLDAAHVVPAPDPVPPILVGGRSDAALTRTARYGDGWLALWVSPERFARAVGQVGERADALGRTGVAWRHGVQVWCGLTTRPGSDTPARLEVALRELYGLSPEAFARYTPCGTPEQVAEALQPYVHAGAASLTLIPVAESFEAAVEGLAQVRALLASSP